MDTRRLLIVAFVALCLGLSGALLRRQLAAHPAPHEEREFQMSPEMVKRYHDAESASALADPGRPVDKHTWHLATGKARNAVLSVIAVQLKAFREGDAKTAMFYQTQAMQHRFDSAQAFQTMIVSQYPEFGHNRAADFGPVLIDPTGKYADVIVTVRGENGRRARGDYWMLREQGGYRAASVQGGHAFD